MSLRDELKKNMPSPDGEIASEGRVPEAERTMRDIHLAMAQNVKEGMYTVSDGVTTVSCICLIDQKYLRRGIESNLDEIIQNRKIPSLFRPATPVSRSWSVFKLEDKFAAEYYRYIDALKKLAKQENIKVDIVVRDNDRNVLYPFPGKSDNGTLSVCYLSVKATVSFS